MDIQINQNISTSDSLLLIQLTSIHKQEER